MSRPTLEVADIIHAQGSRFIESAQQQLSYQQLNVLRAIARCRTAALGGHVDDCPRCGHTAISYNCCRNRHCPKCQAQARQRWLAVREKELLDVAYFHVVFTLPHELIPLCQSNPRILYNLLFHASAATMLVVAVDPKQLGAQIGFLSILHTWGQNLTLHPHMHCVIPAGGLSADHTAWVHPRYPFFLPVKVLSCVFRGKFMDGLNHAHRGGLLRLCGVNATLQQPQHLPSSAKPRTGERSRLERIEKCARASETPSDAQNELEPEASRCRSPGRKSLRRCQSIRISAGIIRDGSESSSTGCPCRARELPSVGPIDADSEVFSMQHNT